MAMRITSPALIAPQAGIDRSMPINDTSRHALEIPALTPGIFARNAASAAVKGVERRGLEDLRWTRRT